MYDSSIQMQQLQDNYYAAQQQKREGTGVLLEQEDLARWEIDTDKICEKVYHNFLGEIENNKGEWEASKFKEVRMNEKGASVLVNEMQSRLHKASLLSELDTIRINQIAKDTGETVADLLADNFIDWDINPLESNFNSIANIIVDNVIIILSSAKNGGMRKHRERSKFPFSFSPPQQNIGGVL